MPLAVCRVHKHGGSLCVVLTKELLLQLPLRNADRLAIRVSGDKFIMQRIPLESLAKLGSDEGIPASG